MAEVCNFQSNHTKGLVLHGLQPTIGLFPLMHQLQGIRQFARESTSLLSQSKTPCPKQE